MIDKSEKFTWLVRIGYFSRALFYTTLGSIALTNAPAMSGGMDGIFEAINTLPGGDALLWVMALGMVGYALFRICSPLFDIENEGSDAPGWGKRIGHAGSALGHLVLAWSAYRLAGADMEGGGADTHDAVAGVLSVNLGGVAIGLLGIAFFLAALAQAKKGLSGSFMAKISAAAPAATRWLGGAGYLARAAVFAVIGWSLVQTGVLTGDADGVMTLADAVAWLAQYGAAFQLVAGGLLLFGLFSFVLARYRIIPDLGDHIDRQT